MAGSKRSMIPSTWSTDSRHSLARRPTIVPLCARTNLSERGTEGKPLRASELRCCPVTNRSVGNESAHHLGHEGLSIPGHDPDAIARRRCLGARHDGRPCAAWAVWDDPRQLCMAHAGPAPRRADEIPVGAARSANTRRPVPVRGLCLAAPSRGRALPLARSPDARGPGCIEGFLAIALDAPEGPA
jgi:hypothetical protein